LKGANVVASRARDVAKVDGATEALNVPFGAGDVYHYHYCVGVVGIGGFRFEGKGLAFGKERKELASICAEAVTYEFD